MAPRHLRAVPDEPEPGAGDGGPDPGVVQEAREIVLRQLTGSPKSRRQLEDKLAERDVPEDVAAAVLDRMEDVRLVDDSAYAEHFVRTRRRTKGLARGALRHELAQKGVRGEDAELALEAISEDEERQSALELVERRLRGRSVPDGADEASRAERDKVVRRLAGMLARKGYPPGMALGVVREVVGGTDDD